MKYTLFLLFQLLAGTLTAADTLRVVRVNDQKAFPKAIPAGNYSGIVPIDSGLYAVVSDKGDDGFFVFDIRLDSLSGDILRANNAGFRPSGLSNRDAEGIAWWPDGHTIMTTGEGDGLLREYNMDGTPTIRQVPLPKASALYGYESLCYDASLRTFWTCPESTLEMDGAQASPQNPIHNRIRVQRYDEALQPAGDYLYTMDLPEARNMGLHYAFGVSELLAVGDGSLLVLEREFYVPTSKIGAWAQCKLYQCWPFSSSDEPEGHPESTHKHLLHEWRTSLGLFGRTLANYEGMCWGPSTADGARVLLLIADSQDQYAGVLKDYLMTIVVR